MPSNIPVIHDPEKTKRCRRCNCTKPHGLFYVNRSTADGRDMYCKRCRRWMTERTKARARAAKRPKPYQPTEEEVIAAQREVDEQRTRAAWAALAANRQEVT